MSSSLRLTRRGLIAAVAAPAARAGAASLVEPVLCLPAGTAGVALTLDACPGGFDNRIAKELVAANIPATIFVTSLWMRWNPAALAFLLARSDLFRLENHGAHHLAAVLGKTTMFGVPAAGTLQAIRQEVDDAAAAIMAATGRRPVWYRGATGRYSPEAIGLVHELGFGVAGYSLVADAGASLPAAAVAARLARAKPGDIIIGHINQPHRSSGEGIVAGIIGLHRQGMPFSHVPDPVGQGYLPQNWAS
jgi:peptidoglycan/xylan/chitin deacetylase (PgdA/CDA1 family)